MRPCSHRSARQQSRPLQPRVCLWLFLAPDAGCELAKTSVCNQPLPTHRHMQPAPAAECVQTTSSGHHHCLPWSLATGPGSNAEYSYSPFSHCRPSTELINNHVVIGVVDPSSLPQQDIMSAWNQSYHMPLHLAPCTTRPGVAAHSRVPLPTGEVFTYQSQSMHRHLPKATGIDQAKFTACIQSAIFLCSPHLSYSTF